MTENMKKYRVRVEFDVDTNMSEEHLENLVKAEMSKSPMLALALMMGRPQVEAKETTKE